MKKFLSVFLSFVMLISVTAGLDITASAASWTLVYEEGDIKIYQWSNGDYFYEDGYNHVSCQSCRLG